MSVLQESRVSRLIAGIDNLPTPPVVYSRINDSISNPNASAYQIASIISEDPAISAKILRLSNSAFYGVRNEITSVKQAVITIGMEAIKSLVLSTSVFDAFKLKKEMAQFQEEFWRHSLAVGSACRMLMRRISTDWMTDADRVFSAGMLHDIGKLVMIVYISEDWEKIQAELEKSDRSQYEMESELLGYNHAQVGAELSTKWNLPGALQDAIAFHHDPEDSEFEDSLSPLVYAANLLSHHAFRDIEEEEVELSEKDCRVLDSLKLNHEKFCELRAPLIEEYAKSEVFLEIAKGL